MTQALYEEQDQPEIFYILRLILNCMSSHSHECNFMWFINQFGSINTPKMIHYPAFLFAFGSLAIILHDVCRFAFSETNQSYAFRNFFPKVGD
jgi:hypothetical protein